MPRLSVAIASALTATIPVSDRCGMSGCVLQGIVRRQSECPVRNGGLWGHRRAWWV